MVVCIICSVFNVLLPKKIMKGRGRGTILVVWLIDFLLRHHLGGSLVPKILWVELLFCGVVGFLVGGKGMLCLLLNQLLSLGSD